MHLRHLSQVVRSQRTEREFLKQSAAEMQERRKMGRGKTAPGGLLSRLSEMLPQLLGIGHREGRAVDDEQAMSQPPPRFADALGHGRRRAGQQRLQGRDRQPTASRAMARAGDVLLGRRRYLITGDVAVENLHQERSHGRHRVELPLAPRKPRFAASRTHTSSSSSVARERFKRPTTSAIRPSMVCILRTNRDDDTIRSTQPAKTPPHRPMPAMTRRRRLTPPPQPPAAILMPL